jgi:hypothetical protein
MKTIKKAIIGILFLLPLLLPAETKAGGPGPGTLYRDGPLDRTLDHPLDNRNLFAPSQRYQRGGGRDAYRPYDPWIDRHAGAGDPVAGDPAYGGSPGGGNAGGGNAVPIDGGMIFLLLAGVGLGIWKMYDYRKRSGAAVLR